jgi:threonine aldolase
MKRNRQFASDNYSGICPEAWTAMAEANTGHEVSYGNDLWTQRAADRLREIFETDCEVFFVFNGTSANSLSLASLCQSYHSVLCHELAHVETSECGAPEFFANGSKILLLSGANGKIDPAEIEIAVNKRTDIHYPKPRALSVTQATETGTVYSVAEIQTLAETARKFGLRLQMDGARFANAVASLGVTPADITWRAGVDVLCFGGSKNGIALGEAVVFFDRELAKDFDYRCKQGGQLASKMRFLSAPWLGMLKDGAWLRHAMHSNEMATRLNAGLQKIPGVKICYPVQSNTVFAKIPKSAEEKLRGRGWQFYTGVITAEESRLMCSWDTTADDVDAFVADLRELSGAN